MTFQPKPKQALVLWKLIITGEIPAQSQIAPRLTTQERQQLVDAGLIELVDPKKLIADGLIDSKSKAKKHIVLTDKAWDWAVEHYNVKLSANTSPAVDALQTLLINIGAFVSSNEFALTDLIRPQPKSDANLEQKIREAYINASDNRYNTQVRLAQMRKLLTNFSSEQIDEALGKMELGGEVVLMTLDDPQEIYPEDEQAAIDLGGQKRYILYMKE